MTGSGRTRNEISGGIFFSAVIQGRDITVQLPREITPALSGLPAATPAFTGRDTDLDGLLRALAPRPAASDPTTVAGSPAVVVTAVGGLAGIGKTELAVQAAHAALAKGWFPGGVLFADLFGYDEARRLEPAQVLEGFLRALGIPGEHIPPEAQDRARLYASVLTAYSGQGQRVLVVIDNVSTSGQAEPLLPTDGTNAALVTSRDTLGLLNARLLDLNVLTPEAAADMLNQTLQVARPGDGRVTGHPGDAAAITRMCSGLPLALRIIAALLAEDPARPLAAMAADLRDERTRLDEISYGDTAVRAAFDLSYRRLDPDRARMFRLLAANPGPDISTSAAAALAGRDQVFTRHGLEVLARMHLIEHGHSYGRWRMHDLVRLYADQHGGTHAHADGRDEGFTRLLDYYLVATQAADAYLGPDISDPATGRFSDREQALAWLDAEYPNLTAATYAAASSGHAAVARDLPEAMWHFLRLRYHFNDWITLATTALTAARHLGDRHSEGLALNSLGVAMRLVGRFEEAIAAIQGAIQIYRDTGDWGDEGVALNSLGVGLQELQRYEEAIAVCQSAVQIFRDIGDRDSEGMALHNLGLALSHSGRFKEAIAVCQSAVQIYRDIGHRHDGMAKALNSLGTVLWQTHRFEEAITAHQEAVQISRDTGDRHDEATALNHLGLARQDLERSSEAITAYQDAIQIYRDLGRRHDEATALNNLGIALGTLERFPEAITAYQDAIQIFRETSDEHAEGVVLDNLGNTLRDLERFTEAITLYQDAIQIYRDTGNQHGTVQALNSLGIILQELERFPEAITAYQDAIQIYRDTGEWDGAAAALNNLGISLFQVRRFEEAITAHQEAVQISRDTGDRRGEGQALNGLGVVLQRVRRFAEATTAYQAAIQIYRDIGDKHNEGVVLDNLGNTLRDLERFREVYRER